LVAERGSSPGLLLALLGHVAMRKLRQVHTAYQLSPRQFYMLGLLHDRGAMSQQDLGAVMEIDPSILITLLNPLEAEGLLSRERYELDRRRHMVRLTGRGAQWLVAASHAQREAEDELFAGLDQNQREQLHGLLVALNASLPGECAAAARATEDCE
jgi:DNA-binding MarR family transcriptional regulator